MKSFIKAFLYCLAFTLVVYGGENISWQKSVSIGFCLGFFSWILDDILAEIKKK